MPAAAIATTTDTTALPVPSKPASGLIRRRVLVVEDDRVTAELLRYVLTEEGWRVHVASTGSEALRVMRSVSPPALVLTDLLVPQVGGFELVRAVRATPGWADVPVVLLTAHWSRACESDALRAGADAAYAKPFDPDELLAAVRRLVEHGRG